MGAALPFRILKTRANGRIECERKPIMNGARMDRQRKNHREKAVHHREKVMNDELAAIAEKHGGLWGRLQVL